MHSSFRDGAAWQDLQAKDPTFFFEAREEMFLVAMASFEENVVWTWKS